MRNVSAKFKRSRTVNTTARRPRVKTLFNLKPEVKRKGVARLVPKTMSLCAGHCATIWQRLRKIEFGKKCQIVFEKVVQILVIDHVTPSSDRIYINFYINFETLVGIDVPYIHFEFRSDRLRNATARGPR